MDKLISVNMCVYNEEIPWLETSISSVLNQTYKFFEFIIVYDNPKNIEILEFLQKKAESDSRIKLYLNEVNEGLSISLNKALSLSVGEYVMKIDADDVCVPERLSRQIDYLERNNIDVISSNYTMISEDGEFIGNGPSRLPSHPDTVKKLLPIANFIAHPSVLYRRKVVSDLHGYRAFPMSVDYDLWLRVLTAGYKIGVLDEPLIYYRVRKASISHKDKLKLYLVIEYEHALYRDRLANGKDSFSTEALDRFLHENGYHDEKRKKSFELAESEYGLLREKGSELSKLAKISVALKMLSRNAIFTRYFFSLKKYQLLQKIYVG
ncbi:MAG: glycosyltransferase [Clostridiaceae bacterium]